MKDLRLEGTTVEEMVSPQLRHRKSIQFFQGLLEDGYRPTNLLDIGCGNGTVTTGIREALKLDLVDGVDILAGRLVIPDWLRLVETDVDKDSLPFQGNSFDAIYCGEILEHLYSPDNLLKEVRRVLSPKGVCLFTTPNLGSWYNRVVLLLGYQPCSISASFDNENVGKILQIVGHRGHIRGFTLRALLELLRIHKLRPVRVMGWNMGLNETYISGSVVKHVAYTVDNVMSRIPSLSARIAVAVRKGLNG